MNVAVVTDGGSGLSPAAGSALGLHVVPMYVSIAGREVRDHELDVADLMDAVHRGEHVSTATPAPGDYLAAIEASGAAGVVIVTVATTFSANFASATAAAGLTTASVEVVDSGTAAGGEMLVATAAWRVAASGSDVHAVAAAARAVAGRVRLTATLGSLEWLARSGRVPQIAAWTGRTLRLCPMFSLQGGRVERHRPAIGRSAAVDRIVSACRSSAPAGTPTGLHIAALHGRDEAAGRELLERAIKGVDVAEAHLCPFSVGMMVHSGPDLAGLAWWWEGHLEHSLVSK